MAIATVKKSAVQVTLTLSEEEALALRVVGNFVGGGLSTPRGKIDAINSALDGVINEHNLNSEYMKIYGRIKRDRHTNAGGGVVFE
jgi:hypothetical protein